MAPPVEHDPHSVTSAAHPARRLGAVLVAGALALAACGGDESSDGAATPAEPATESSADEAGAAFPVTIAHAFGETVVEEAPERVVTVGFSDHDPVLALGVVPVGLRQWYGDHPNGVWPWAEDLLGGQQPELIDAAALNFEQIAALDPDLILGLYIELEDTDYEALSQIAPTIAQSGEHPSFGTPWQEMTRTAGLALGRSSEAEALISSVEQTFADARAAHPEFTGVGLAYAGIYGEAQYYVETAGSTRMQILLDLGFEVPDELAALGGDSFYHEISAEQLELLDQDVVFWEPADLAQLPEVESNPIYQALPVAQEDREVFLTDPTVAGAMAHSTVLSLPVVLDAIVPDLEAAVSRL